MKILRSEQKQKTSQLVVMVLVAATAIVSSEGFRVSTLPNPQRYKRDSPARQAILCNLLCSISEETAQLTECADCYNDVMNSEQTADDLIRFLKQFDMFNNGRGSSVDGERFTRGSLLSRASRTRDELLSERRNGDSLVPVTVRKRYRDGYDDYYPMSSSDIQNLKDDEQNKKVFRYGRKRSSN